MVDFVSEQGLSIFETAGIACYFEDFEKCENAALGRKMPFMDGHLNKRLYLNHIFFFHGLPQIILGLLNQPAFRTAAKGFGQPDRHLR